MSKERFKVGDKVFAKVKGYPAWPAKIVSVVGNKYNVEFYGTKETGQIKEGNVFYYLKNKARLTVNIRRKLFHDAMAEIEEVIGEEGGDGDLKLGEPGCPSIGEQGSGGDRETDATAAATAGGSRGNGKRKRSGSGVGRRKRLPKLEEDCTENEFSCSEKDEQERLDTSELEEIIKQEEEDIDTCRNFQFTPISEKYLNNCIAYAKYVMESAPFYKASPIEPRDDALEPVLAVKLSSGTVAGIKLYRKWPLPDFSNELERALYDETSAKRTLDYKNLVESPEGVQKIRKLGVFVRDLGVTMEAVKHELWTREQAERTRRRNRLVVETSLAHHEIQIKRCLRVDGAEPAEALVHLISIDSMPLDSLTLRKFPRIVTLVRKLRRYDGNVDEWNMTKEAREEFERGASRIREKAVEMYERLKEKLNLPDNGKPMYSNFIEMLLKFQQQCHDLTDKQRLALCAEPKSRRAFMDRVNETDLEKENSSNVANSEQETATLPIW